MIRIEPDKNRVQWTGDDGAHYVGRLLFAKGEPVMHPEFFVWSRVVRLDYGRGDVIIEANRLRPYPDAPIPEPTNQGAGQ